MTWMGLGFKNKEQNEQRFFFDEEISAEKKETDILEYLTKLILDPKTPERVSLHLGELRATIINERNKKC